MKSDIPIFEGYALRIADKADQKRNYATSDLQKGFQLVCQGESLAEEAIGFGVPVLKLGLRTIFPGKASWSFSQKGPEWHIDALFALNLEEKLSVSGSHWVTKPWIYSVKNLLAAFIRGFPPMRPLLTAASSLLRHLLGLQTKYLATGYFAEVEIHYIINGVNGTLHCEVDSSLLNDEKITEVMIMNEQGAQAFDQYHDSSGIELHESQIGCWDKVMANRAWFASSRHNVQFSLPRIEGAQLFRGREQIGSRLSWAGFGYSFPPSLKKFRYDIVIGKKP